ncbi:MAG: carbamate kinase [Actinobacteria bacterium]|nr:carbamate kinase [Actinomycetota bacterium]
MSKKTIVIALGGNALLKRSDPMTAEAQRANVRVAVAELAPLAEEYDLVLAHGNGPQVGLLALQAAAYEGVEPYPLDVLGAESQGMIAYMLEQELGNVLPAEKPIATVLTMVEVDLADPAFVEPTKFVGPGYEKAEAEALAGRKGWVVKQDGEKWRRVVPSPEPKRIFEIRPIKWLLDRDCIVICAGGGGIPTAFDPNNENRLMGVEAVIDKDLASELLARELDAHMFVMATDTDGVYVDWGSPQQRRLGWVTPEKLDMYSFAEGSMGPKVEAAKRFVKATGRRAAIGRLEDIAEIVEGRTGTNVVAGIPREYKRNAGFE